MFAAAIAGAIWRAYPDHRPLQIANAGALVAFFIGAEWAGEPGVFAAFMTAAGAMLIVALLQESHQLAFRDELTGLPGRRALDERLRSLGARYALAMVDVDHFKKFNDNHGHDIGDQVLKLVAGRLAQVGGGGIAYRYGGEEFSVLFPDRDMEAAAQHLDAIRFSIENYRMAVRGTDRPRNPKPDDSAKLRINKPAHKTLSVTVSVGVSQPGDALRTPVQVLKAADEALYRAKQAGRNRVSK
jgi:GGDEF domain-containing protein